VKGNQAVACRIVGGNMKKKANEGAVCTSWTVNNMGYHLSSFKASKVNEKE
jgi:hypothetical protein